MITSTAPSTPASAGSRGWLKNGNRPGDYRTAPRCGAKTRHDTCCTQPAMRNGRCRFHGGKSTGARTAAGRARCARARRTHGFYSAETAALRRQARAHLRRVRTLVAGARARPSRPAGHGVLPSESRRQKTEDGRRLAATASLPPVSHDAAPRTFCPPSSVVRPPAPAGHGVLRSFFGSALDRAARWLGLRA
jgi:hypothetical protein